jgi:hypothetical protein
MTRPFFLDDDGYYWTIRFQAPVDSDVHVLEQEVFFKRLGNARTKEIMRLAVEKNKHFQETGEMPTDDLLSDEALADEILGGWRTMKSRAGEEIAYTEQSRSRFLDCEGIPAAIVTAWYESKRARTEGNFEAPPALSGS